MHLDISRARFAAAKQYSSVIRLQGRVMLDADDGEQSEILLHYIRTVVADLIGPYGVPSGSSSAFAITAPQPTNGNKKKSVITDFAIGTGRMYVDGILVENFADTSYLSQPASVGINTPAPLSFDGSLVAYLRVWEREVTAIQDPDLREVALGMHAPDTTARSQVVWAVGVVPLEATDAATFEAWVTNHTQPKCQLSAQAIRGRTAGTTDLCSTAPSAQFRGRENQLYRVEVFQSGTADPVTGGSQATFVWSRENGSVVFPIASVEGQDVTVDDLGRDLPSGLDVGDWVEIVDDGATFAISSDDPASAPTRALFQVTAIDPLDRVVTLDKRPSDSVGSTGTDPTLRPLLRRWDGGPDNVAEGTYLDLEDGVQVMFSAPSDATAPATYRSGDYWLIPARTVTGDVIWPPGESGAPLAVDPHGIDYHYAPLAYWDAAGSAWTPMLGDAFEPLVHL